MTMVVLGWWFPVMHFDAASLGSRALAATAILTAAGLVRLARSMRDRLEQKSLRAQAADRLKANIFANLSHELRTPLNAIIGFAELLLTDCRPDQRNALEHLQSAGRRLLLTVENLLDLSRAPNQVLRAEQIDLAAILGQAIDAARTASFARQITLLNSITADTPPAIGDAWATRRIADNLIGNAIKFTPPGGSVRVATEAAEGRACAVVTDTGSGMPPEVLDQLGEPFFQAKSPVWTVRTKAWAPAWRCAASWPRQWTRGSSSPVSPVRGRRCGCACMRHERQIGGAAAVRRRPEIVESIGVQTAFHVIPAKAAT